MGDNLGDLIRHEFGKTGKEYADNVMAKVGSTPQQLLGGPPVNEYVVIAALIVDTAIILATSEQEASEKYEIPEDLVDRDIAVWAMTRKEFAEAHMHIDCGRYEEPEA